MFPLKPSIRQIFRQNLAMNTTNIKNNSIWRPLYRIFEMLNGTSIARLLYWGFGEWTYFYIWQFFSLKPKTKNTTFTTFLRYFCEKNMFFNKPWQSCLNFEKKTRVLRKIVDFFHQNAEIVLISF